MIFDIIDSSRLRRRINKKIEILTLKHLKIKMDMSKIRLSSSENHVTYFRLMSESGQIEHDIKLIKGLLSPEKSKE